MGDRLKVLREEFTGGYATEEECADAIDYLFGEYGYLVDPHTAVGYAVGSAYCDEGNMIFVSTASPVKFASAVLNAIGEEAPSGDEKALKKLEDVTAFEVPESVKALFGMKERFTDVIDASDVGAEIEKFARQLSKS